MEKKKGKTSQRRSTPARNFRALTETDISEIISASGVPLPDGEVDTYEVGDFDTLVKKPRIEALRDRLNMCLGHYLSLVTVVANSGPSPSKAAKDFGKIATATIKLWHLLQLKSDQLASDLPGHPLYALRASALRCVHLAQTPYEFKAKVYEVVDGIRLLNIWARDAAKIKRQRITKSKDRNPGDEPMRVFIETLMDAWFDIFNSLPVSKYDVAKDVARSPFLLFCIEVITRSDIDKNVNVAALHKTIGRVTAKPPWDIMTTYESDRGVIVKGRRLKAKQPKSKTTKT